jgi:hypothetical protein
MHQQTWLSLLRPGGNVVVDMHQQKRLSLHGHARAQVQIARRQQERREQAARAAQDAEQAKAQEALLQLRIEAALASSAGGQSFGRRKFDW